VYATSGSIPTRHLPRVFLSDVLFVLSLYAGKEWLLDYEVGVFWVVMRVLACGGLGVLVWEGLTKQIAKRKSVQNIEVRHLFFVRPCVVSWFCAHLQWPLLGTASLLLFLQQASLFTALYRLSSTRSGTLSTTSYAL